jgi:Zn-dependent protease
MSITAPDAKTTCAGCGTEVAASLLSCPVCHRLVHGQALKELAGRAETAAARGDLREALGAWRSSLELLPPGSRQHVAIAQRIEALSAQVESTSSAATPVPKSGAWKWLAALGPIGLLLWKFKFIVVAILTKGKLLLLGLTKTGTLLSMFATVGVYWTVWGLWFAVGLVVSIYIHEMGHVAALRRLGIKASAPMFVPGLGAFVRMKQLPASPHEEARVGLAGPVWGLFTALACAAVALAMGSAYWSALAVWGARINLFNLIPVRPLDGGRGLLPLSRREAVAVTGVIGGTLLLTGEGMLWLLLLAAGGQLVAGGAPGPGDRRAAVTYSLLVAALGALCLLPVAAP